MQEEKPSAVLYLMPIVFNAIGGIIMYALLRKEDKDMAETGFTLGFIIMALEIAITFAIYVLVLHRALL